MKETHLGTIIFKTKEKKKKKKKKKENKINLHLYLVVKSLPETDSIGINLNFPDPRATALIYTKLIYSTLVTRRFKDQ